MSTYSIDELLAFTTPEAIKAQIYSILDSSGVATTAWQPLSPLRTIIDVVSRLIATLQNLVVTAIRGSFLDTSDGAWLKTTSQQMYGVTAIEAEFAFSAAGLVLDNLGGGTYSFDPGEFVVKNTITGKTYFNPSVINIPALTTGILIDIQATEIGTASNAAPGQITELVTQALGVTCTNPAAVVGADAETDDELKERDRDSLGALSPNGAPGAYVYVAKTPSLNGGVVINRAVVLPPFGDGTLTLVVASSEGTVSGGDVALLQTAIDELCTPESVTATVVSATAANQLYTTGAGRAVTVYTSSGLTSSEVRDLVKAAMVAYVKALPIGGLNVGGGGRLLWRAMLGAIENVQPKGTITQAILQDETDAIMGIPDVAVLDPANIDITVVSV